MASRTLTPLRAVSRRLQSPANVQSLSHLPRQTFISASKAKPYSVPPRSTSPSTASKATPPTSTTSTSTSTYKPTPTQGSTSTSTPARTPVPAVSGVPLPDAPSATFEPTSTDNDGNSSGSGGSPIDWTQSYHGLGTSSFGPEVAAVLQARLDPDDIEVKPDGIIYLPEIKYRRILNAAFGPGGWGLAPRGQLMVHEKLVTREYALVVHGRFVAQARGEQQYFNEEGVSTAAEGCKSNALMRCCKDLGIASELWDPRFIRKFMKEHAMQQWVEHVTTKKKKQIWLRKDDEVRYPFKKS
ncbi:Mgm101p-domain-containing protein [Annulohypoxylon truncatum]|uniref:Mgm101p-domain-containing protein n=1 Tax=Annulohypoxylon truncatum TaxID=327061 RepID=UPI002007C2B7|nr:Mgm101p-domain-containing protein [Annulohypoxylon truncatum]KAI1211428.1 Mgm101p-domain-containing protein [Annulohypoxylon truncatum]